MRPDSTHMTVFSIHKLYPDYKKIQELSTVQEMIDMIAGLGGFSDGGGGR